MNWQQVNKLEFTDEEMETIDFYCSNEMRELKKICNAIIKKSNVDKQYYDDLYSDALMVLMESIKDFDGEKANFKTFLSGNLKRSFYDWNRDNFYRAKRSPLLLDKKGRIVKEIDEYGKEKPIRLQTVSFDEPARDEDKYELKEKISKTESIEEEISENVEKYLNTLSEIEKEIANLIIEGYSFEEIKGKLQLSDKKFAMILNNMKKFEKQQVIHSNDSKIIKEEKNMSNQTTTLEKSKPDRMSIASIIKKIDNCTIRFNHPLQRQSAQWSNIMMGNLISDILQGNPIPSLIFAEQIVNGIAIIWDLDGKQRCTNAYSFSKDGFKISKNVRRWLISYQSIIKDENGKSVLDENGFPKTERREFDIRNKKFSQLPEELQDKFMDYNFEIVQYLNCSTEDIAYHIARYNEGKPMNGQQKGIINLGEEFAAITKGISAMPFFQDMANYSPSERKNSTLERIVIESIMLINFIDDWKKDQMKMCDFIKENATEEMFDDFESLICRLTKVSTNDEVLEEFNSKHSFIWFGLFERFSKKCDDDKRFIKFMAECSQPLHKLFDEIEFDENGKKRSSTKDKSIVIAKINEAEKLMNEFLHIEEKSDELNEKVENNEVEDAVETVISSHDFNEVDACNMPLEAKNDTDSDVLSFCKETVSSEIQEEDVELYKDMVDDCVRIDTPVYQNCKNALIGLMGFACRQNKDEEFECWIADYQKDKSNFSPSQKVNYAYMKNDFTNYCAAMA